MNPKFLNSLFVILQIVWNWLSCFFSISSFSFLIFSISSFNWLFSRLSFSLIISLVSTRFFSKNQILRRNSVFELRGQTRQRRIFEQFRRACCSFADFDFQAKLDQTFHFWKDDFSRTSRAVHDVWHRLPSVSSRERMSFSIFKNLKIKNKKIIF